MTFQMIVCLCCLVACLGMLIANLIVYWQINKALKKAAEKEKNND